MERGCNIIFVREEGEWMNLLYINDILFELGLGCEMYDKFCVIIINFCYKGFLVVLVCILSLWLRNFIIIYFLLVFFEIFGVWY